LIEYINNIIIDHNGPVVQKSSSSFALAHRVWAPPMPSDSNFGQPTRHSAFDKPVVLHW
jgi:hypothetical protein